MPEIRMTLIADEGAVVRQLAAFLHGVLAVPRKELTRERVITLVNTEAWQKAYASHCLLRDYGQGAGTFGRKTGKDYHDLPGLKEVIAQSEKVFNALWDAVEAAGFSQDNEYAKTMSPEHLLKLLLNAV